MKLLGRSACWCVTLHILKGGNGKGGICICLPVHCSETGRLRFRGARFQTLSSVSFFGAHWVSASELSEFLSAYYLCAKANSPSFFAELTEFAPKLSEAHWVLSSKTVLSKQYSARFLIVLSARSDRQPYCHTNGTSSPCWRTIKSRVTIACPYIVGTTRRGNIVLRSPVATQAMSLPPVCLPPV